MTRYETVPLDENQARAQAAAGSAAHDATAKPKQHVRIYARVASNDAPSEDFNAPKSELCVNRYMLLGLATFFACSTLIIGVLYHFSSVRLGLTSETHAHRYAWLYGPTAGERTPRPLGTSKLEPANQFYSCCIAARNLARG